MGIISVGRPEWPISHISGYHNSITTVPFYESWDAETIKFAIGLSKLTTMSVSEKHAEKLLKIKKEDADG